MIRITAPTITANIIKPTTKLEVKRTSKRSPLILDLGKYSVTSSLHTTKLSSSMQSPIMIATISRVIIPNEKPDVPMSVNLYFTSSDLTNNKLTKYHGFNQAVDVSVFNEHKEEVEVDVDISDPNRVTIDLGRLQVTGNWQIKIEA